MRTRSRGGASGCAAARCASPTRPRRPGTGIGYLSEDRKHLGLLLEHDVAANITLSSLAERFTRWAFVNHRAMRAAARRMVESLRIRTPSVPRRPRTSPAATSRRWSIAKWLVKDCDILIFDEPTRGIDVGAKEEIYKLLNDLAAAGQVDHHDLL